MQSFINIIIIIIILCSILGRIIRINDKVILYRQWIRDAYALHSTQRMIINNYLTTSNISSNNVSVSTNTSSRASTVSSGSGSTESVSIIFKHLKFSIKLIIFSIL